MRLREFDEKEKLEKANEKLTKYKTAAGADATAADAAGNLARGNTRFKGINRATKKQFANDAKLAKLKEFAPSGDDGDGFSEETLKQLAAQWYNGDEDPRVEQTLMSAGWEIGQDEGYDNGGVFVVRAGDDQGDSYISWPSEELAMNEGRKKKKKKSSKSLSRYFFPGYGYYGSGESGEGGGGDGGGESANPRMSEGEYDSRKPFGVRYKVFAGREGRLTTREYYTSSEEKLQRAVAKIQALDNFYEIDGYSYPKEQQGVTEGSEQKPAITYKDYTLQYDYQTEDDDPEGYSTATTYYFDVLKDGDRVGEAEYFDYFGNLTIIINGQTMEFKYRHPLAMQISQLVSSLPDEQKKDLSDPRFESQGVAEGLTEMDKSEPSAGRDTGPRSGPDREAKPITPKKATKDAEDVLTKAFRDSQRVDPRTGKKMNTKGVAEATDSATSNLIWKAMNYLPHDRPKDMEDILVQIAHNQGPVTRVTDDPEKLASLVQAVWMDGQTRKQKVGQQGMAESNVFTDARMNAIKADQDTFVVHGKTYQVTGDTSDERQAGLAEDSIAAMRRLAGIVPQVPLIVSNGQRQYRHMPTAVQPR